MADRLSVSHSAVQRIWSNPGIKPHRMGAFKVSTDPAFEDKLIGVVGLYLNPRAPRGADVSSGANSVRAHEGQHQRSARVQPCHRLTNDHEVIDTSRRPATAGPSDPNNINRRSWVRQPWASPARWHGV